MKQVDLWTDGACSGNPGPGGWAAILVYGSHQPRELSGGDKQTTNNRMELTGVIEGLSALKGACRVRIHTDSSYVLNAFVEGWVYNWKRNGWRTKAKKPVANQELWQILMALVEKHEVEWVKVKGHSGVAHNERADQLAVAAAGAYK